MIDDAAAEIASDFCATPRAVCAFVGAPCCVERTEDVAAGVLAAAMLGLSHPVDGNAGIPQNRRQDYNATTFLKMGTCAEYGRVAHQYANYLTAHPEKNEYMWYDISDRSCLNGW